MPATPTITVTDNENGTATVAVADSDAGTTNTAYYAFARGGSWNSGGSRTGDGNIIVTPTYERNTGGVYHWRLESSDGTIAHSNVLLNRVSKSSMTTYERICEAVHSEIQSIGLTGISDNAVVLQTSPDAVMERMIIVAPFGKERMLTGQKQRTDVRDDTVYPVIVAHVDAADRSQSATDRDLWLRWRQDIARTFRSQHLTGVDEVYDCIVQHRESVDTNAWFKANQCVGAMILQFTAREVRTL